jgi:hypothetical protein
VSASKPGEELQADESLIVSTAANAVAFDNSTTLTAVTLADGIQAFVAQDIKLDPGREFLFCILYVRLQAIKIPGFSTVFHLCHHADLHDIHSL